MLKYFDLDRDVKFAMVPMEKYPGFAFYYRAHLAIDKMIAFLQKDRPYESSTIDKIKELEENKEELDLKLFDYMKSFNGNVPPHIQAQFMGTFDPMVLHHFNKIKEEAMKNRYKTYSFENDKYMAEYCEKWFQFLCKYFPQGNNSGILRFE